MFTILALSFALAFFQSFLGVGLLLLGTPLLLSLGYEFLEVQNALLPASICLGGLQSWELRTEAPARQRRFQIVVICLPTLALGIWLNTRGIDTNAFLLLIGMVLAVGILVRLGGEAHRRKIQAALVRFEGISLAVTGLLHGVCNMGGPVLVTLAAGRYHTPKAYLAFVSWTYALLATGQLVGLALQGELRLDARQVILQLLLIWLAHKLVTSPLRRLARTPVYQRLLTGLLTLNLLLLALKFSSI